MLFAAAGVAAALACAAEPLIQWREPVVVAAGPAVQGEWRQNDSRYDYVDDPTVVLDGRGHAAVAWVDQRSRDVYFQCYEAAGRACRPRAVNVSRSPEVYSWLPRLALSRTDPDQVYVLWQEIVFAGGSHGGDIFFARSVDGGATFGGPLNLTRSVGGDGKGRIHRDYWHNGSLDLALADDGTLHAAWTEYEGALWVSRSDDGGATFTLPVRLARGPDAPPARAPALAADAAGNVYLAWTVGEDAAADIRLARSADRGRTYTELGIVSRTPGYSDAPKLAVTPDGVLHLAYAESAAGPFDRHVVRYTRSVDGGRSFEPERAVSQPLPAGIVSAGFPSLAVAAPATIVMTWELFPDVRGRPRGLGIAVSVDGGKRFSPAAVVPHSRDPGAGDNGSRQGLLMRKLAVGANGEVAVVNSAFRRGVESRVWLMRGRLREVSAPGRQ